MEYKIAFNQNDLLLKVNKNYDKSKIDLGKWERYLDILCENREYQKDAIKSSVIFLASGLYQSTNELVTENYKNNSEMQKKYSNIDEYLARLQIVDKLFANIDLATGTGKSYVMFGIAQIMLSEGIVNRVLVLCPSLTIENGLMQKFTDLAMQVKLREAIPEHCLNTNPSIISANETIKLGNICIENIHAVYETTGSSIEDSFKNGGEDTLILNDESHHIFNKPFGQKKENDGIKKWKEFLINEKYNFRYMLGFTGTAYVDNEYFNDVIYRYSLRQAIDDKVVKSIDYVQKDDIGNNRNFKFQKIHQNHEINKTKFSKIKPLSILVTKDIKSANNLADDFKDFLIDYEEISCEEAEKKVLVVTSDSKHKANISMLEFVDKKDNRIEWIISVSMLTEGWDVKNVFQIVPWEDRAFNSKLLIAQVLGRGLRLPLEYTNPQPSVIVFNHDNWSKNIKSLVNEILEIETKIISTLRFTGDRNQLNFEVKNLSYEKEEKETITAASGKGINYTNAWESGIKLKSQSLTAGKETEYENLVTSKITTRDYNIKLRTKSVDEVLNKIFHEFALRDWESEILGLGDNVVYSKNNLPPRDKIEKIIRKSMDMAGIVGDILIEENANKIFSAFSTLFRVKSKTVIYSVKSTDFITLNTRNMKDETKGLSSFKHDATLFYSDRYQDEIPNEEQLKIVEDFIKDDNFPRYASYQQNYFDFKTPINMVVSIAEPERKFIRDYLCKHENAKHIESWIKSRDMGFYSIEYSYKISSHTKQGSFNPDFIIKLSSEDSKEFVVIEIKDDKDDSPENKGKNKAAKAHFEKLNKKLEEYGYKEKYMFHFLSPDDYNTFFTYLRDNKIESFISGLDTLLEENVE